MLNATQLFCHISNLIIPQIHNFDLNVVRVIFN